jgi:hypothetical protein
MKSRARGTATQDLLRKLWRKEKLLCPQKEIKHF